MPRLINFDLISNPLNWAIVFMMLFIAGIAVALLNKAGSDT
jgi:hypothetical protein